MFEKLKYFSTIFFGTFIIAVGVYFFMNPNHIISGSISGLAVVLVNFVPLSLVRHDAALKHHLHHPGIPLRG